jgi:hypothetical protein
MSGSGVVMAKFYQLPCHSAPGFLRSYDLTFWMRPTPADLEVRARVIVPLRAFADRPEAAAFGNAARYWHAAATGGDPHWWDEADR